jgi:hypothetical protein
METLPDVGDVLKDGTYNWIVGESGTMYRSNDQGGRLD